MSKLEELFDKLCPDGVIHCELGTFAKSEKGKNNDRHCELAYSITKSGLVPTADYFKKAKVTSDDTSGYRIVKYNWFVYSPSRIDVGSINYLRDETEVIVSPLNVVFSIDESIIFPQYLLYFLQSRSGTWQIITNREGIGGTGRKLLPFEKFAKIRVPVPPLQVQSEIVRILDNFTKLIAELTAELTARKKQYAYYRDSLLTFCDGVEWNALGEVCEIKTGSKPKKIFNERNSYEYINAGTTNSGFTEIYNCDGDTVTTPSRGQGGIGFVGYQKDKFFLGPLCYKIQSQNKTVVLTKYIFYYLQSNNDLIFKIKNEGGVPSVNRIDLIKLPVAIPPLAEQERIVAMLDRFDTLCNDISSGLPAEIEARQKQYEYYRDKLLTLKELS